MNRYLLIALAACAVAILFGWQHIERQADQLATARDQVTTLTKAAKSRRNTQRLLADLDTEHTKALTDAQADNRKLRTAVATGQRRLSVLATRTTTGAAGVGDAEARAELDPAAGERIVAITDDGDQGLIALRAAQDYINTVCLGGTTQKGR
ncbi:lysis system i-spanin subunit Rz [Pseudomonas sp. MWU12-3103b]|uniref:lysis system i-spanin subunit Rz n=1 Tax=Pseudomonas sp. MWU12-3103b TaxID=2928857 RepID=UPI001FFF7D0B|nr:lysis system i-spanin subunit Rz [Pseudomonas sp. MWU12-3103b]